MLPHSGLAYIGPNECLRWLLARRLGGFFMRVRARERVQTSNVSGKPTDLGEELPLTQREGERILARTL
jgi:hypothetical protein